MAALVEQIQVLLAEEGIARIKDGARGSGTTYRHKTHTGSRMPSKSPVARTTSVRRTVTEPSQRGRLAISDRLLEQVVDAGKRDLDPVGAARELVTEFVKRLLEYEEIEQDRELLVRLRQEAPLSPGLEIGA